MYIKKKLFLLEIVKNFLGKTPLGQFYYLSMGVEGRGGETKFYVSL